MVGVLVLLMGWFCFMRLILDGLPQPGESLCMQLFS